MIIGYTTGVFDLFHIGHVNMLRNANSLCDKLIAGVTTDDLVSYKGKKAVIPFEERLEVVRACRYVDLAVPQEDMDKVKAVKKLGADIIFVGDDWYESEKWQDFELALSKVSCEVKYFPYTKATSSTKINSILDDIR
jgi:glycerol-3-phosphate cytidylyltransferase